MTYTDFVTLKNKLLNTYKNNNKFVTVYVSWEFYSMLRTTDYNIIFVLNGIKLNVDADRVGKEYGLTEKCNIHSSPKDFF